MLTHMHACDVCLKITLVSSAPIYLHAQRTNDHLGFIYNATSVSVEIPVKPKALLRVKLWLFPLLLLGTRLLLAELRCSLGECKLEIASLSTLHCTQLA